VDALRNFAVERGMYAVRGLSPERLCEALTTRGVFAGPATRFKKKKWRGWLQGKNKMDVLLAGVRSFVRQTEDLCVRHYLLSPEEERRVQEAAMYFGMAEVEVRNRNVKELCETLLQWVPLYMDCMAVLFAQHPFLRDVLRTLRPRDLMEWAEAQARRHGLRFDPLGPDDTVEPVRICEYVRYVADVLAVMYVRWIPPRSFSPEAIRTPRDILKSCMEWQTYHLDVAVLPRIANLSIQGPYYVVDPATGEGTDYIFRHTVLIDINDGDVSVLSGVTPPASVYNPSLMSLPLRAYESSLVPWFLDVVQNRYPRGVLNTSEEIDHYDDEDSPYPIPFKRGSRDLSECELLLYLQDYLLWTRQGRPQRPRVPRLTSLAASAYRPPEDVPAVTPEGLPEEIAERFLLERAMLSCADPERADFNELQRLADELGHVLYPGERTSSYGICAALAPRWREFLES